MSNNITCPKCGEKINVTDILYHQVDEEIREKYRAELVKDKEKYKVQIDALNKERQALEAEKENHENRIAKEIKEGIKKQEAEMKIKLKAEVIEEQSSVIKDMKDELIEKSEKLKDFNKAKSDIERLIREKEELKGQYEVEAEKKISVKINEEREKIQKSESERVQLKIAEKEKIISQLHEQLVDAQRKAEQGSMQLQGEVLELAIEEWLSSAFPLDTIEEIKKGALGADCLQIVNTRTRQNCGTIYYESKRTKGFQPSWIEKFKKDIRDKNADIGVLVTESMPSDMERMGLKDGVWICTFDEFRGLCLVLRESIIKLSNAMVTQENKGDKMEMLYGFLTGNEFRGQVEAIVEGFTQMNADMESEKRAMAGIWKKREKQIEKVLLNTTHMYSSIKGIAGNAIQPLALLELSEE